MAFNQEKIKEAKAKKKKNPIFDDLGWANAFIHKPIPFDLVKVLTKKGKRKCAWWGLSQWNGLKITKHDIIVKWRPIASVEEDLTVNSEWIHRNPPNPQFL